MNEAPELNINEEYEKLVPPTKRERLFDESENYESFRNYIMSQPVRILKNPKLPFQDVKVQDYPEFMRESFIDKETAAGKHLFFIKQSQRGELEYCFASGYYDKETKTFMILPYSFIVNQAYDNTHFQSQQRTSKNKDGNIRYTTSFLAFNTPEEAASFVLGHKAGLDIWRDQKGKGLIDFYPSLTSVAISNVPVEESLHSDLVDRGCRFLKDSCSENSTKKMDIGSHLSISEAIGDYLKRKKAAAQSAFRRNEIHLFYIQKEGEVKNSCQASGYYDVASKKFVLREGSIWASEVTKVFQYSAADFLRRHLIQKNCKVTNGCITQTRDILCGSPSEAASYVLGRKANGLEEWKDIEGYSLKRFKEMASITDMECN